MTILLSLEPQARSLTDRENTGLWTKGMSSAYIRVKEVRGQVPGTHVTGHAQRVRSTTNRPYVRAEREWRARDTGVEPLEWNT